MAYLFGDSSPRSPCPRGAERRLGSLLTLLSLCVTLRLVTLLAPCTEHLLQQRQTTGWLTPCVTLNSQEMVRVSLMVWPPQLLAEQAWPAVLALPGPFFLYSSALSQGLWCCSRCCVCLDLQHLPASRSLPTHLPPTPAWWLGTPGGAGVLGVGGTANQSQCCQPQGCEESR